MAGPVGAAVANFESPGKALEEIVGECFVGVVCQ